MIKLCLGAGSDPQMGFINIDKYVENSKPDYEWIQSDILDYLKNLKVESVDEIYSRWVFEHISFVEEKDLWINCFRVLKKGGLLKVVVPDFEFLCRQFLKAKDGFKTFYKLTTDKSDSEYGFGFGEDENLNYRFGPLITHFFGHQSNEGQFHKSAYTQERLKGISNFLGFKSSTIKKWMDRGIEHLELSATK